MITRARHLNTKFVDDPTDPTQLIAYGVKQSMDFWDLSQGFHTFLESNIEEIWGDLRSIFENIEEILSEYLRRFDETLKFQLVFMN